MSTLTQQYNYRMLNIGYISFGLVPADAERRESAGACTGDGCRWIRVVHRGKSACQEAHPSRQSAGSRRC